MLKEVDNSVDFFLELLAIVTQFAFFFYSVHVIQVLS